MTNATSISDRSAPAEAVASKQGPVIILIEDEPEIRRFLRAALLSHGYRLVEAATGQEGLQAAETRQPDLIILDLGLPDMDGLEVMQQLRAWTAVPIIVLSAKGQETVKVASLDEGADDYIAKPFGVGELLARIRVALRHADRAEQGDITPVYTAGDLQVDFARRRVRVKGKDVHLTPIEYRLITTLAKHAGKILTRNQLLTEVWGRPYGDRVHYLHVHTAQLRRKIEDDPSRPRYLLTEPGVGYQLVAENA